MLSRQPLSTRAAVDLDSTAVLVFDDGTRIPCDRYLMRTLCEVVRSLLDSTAACEADDRRRTLVPMPGRDAAPFWTAVDVLHGVVAVRQLAVPEIVETLRCL